MMDMLPDVKLPVQFSVKLESYWQSIAIYAVTLIAYVIIKAMWNTTLQDGIVNVVVTDPIVVLIGLFVVISIIALAIAMITKRRIIINEDSITFLSRYHERTFKAEEIDKIKMGRDRRVRVRGVMSHVKMYIKGRRRPLRIRPAVYEDEKHLVSALLSLRKNIAKEQRQAT